MKEGQASKDKKGITLTELLIVVMVIAILLVVLLSAFKPWAQQAKARDSRRKTDLHRLKNSLEDYYNDKNCYPTTDEGLDNLVPDYLGELPTAPSADEGYLYVSDDCDLYRIYTTLEFTTDPESAEVGCGAGCGPGGGGEPGEGSCDYNYGVCSPGDELEGCTEKCVGGRVWSSPPDCEAPNLGQCNTTACCADGVLTCYPDGYWCCPLE